VAKDKSTNVIASSELLRFSHSIPSYRTNGNEKVGSPAGFIELDTACLPNDMDIIFPSVPLESYISLGKPMIVQVVKWILEMRKRRICLKHIFAAQCLQKIMKVFLMRKTHPCPKMAMMPTVLAILLSQAVPPQVFIHILIRNSIGFIQ
jgi:hypothetical protein